MGCRKSNCFVRLPFSSAAVISLYPFGVARKWSSHGALPGHRILPNRSAKADAHRCALAGTSESDDKQSSAKLRGDSGMTQLSSIGWHETHCTPERHEGMQLGQRSELP
jgi:hypothetical protein